MNRSDRLYLIGCLGFCLPFLASCGSGNSGIYAAVPRAAARVRHAQPAAVPDIHATLAVTLPPIYPPNLPIIWSPAPNGLSSATKSIAGSIGRRRFGPIVLSVKNKACTQGSMGLTCTLQLRAPIGQRKELRLFTYARRDGTGLPLATARTPVNIYPGQSNHAVPAFQGLAHSLAIEPQGTVRQGQWASVSLVVYGIDAAKKPIPSQNVWRRHAAPIGPLSIVASGFVHQTLAPSNGQSYYCCGSVVAFNYDGLHTGTETFTVSAKGFAPKSASMTVQAGSTTLATLMTYTGYLQYPTSLVAQFLSAADGDVAPIRAFVLGGGPLFGEDMAGNFWFGDSKYSNTGKMLGTVKLTRGFVARARDVAGHLYAFGTSSALPGCQNIVFEYPSNTFGTLTPVREIDLPGCAEDPLAVDASGNVFVSFASSGSPISQPAEILEYSAGGGSGQIAPSRAITMPIVGNYDTFEGLDVDAAGNLYAQYFPSSADYELLEFAPGTTTPAETLNINGLKTFAVDDQGNVYARVYTQSPALNALETFPPGSTTPERIINGPATELYYNGAITVARSS